MSHQQHSTRSQQRRTSPVALPTNDVPLPQTAPSTQAGILKLSANAPSFFPASFPLNQSHQKSEVSPLPTPSFVNGAQQGYSPYPQMHVASQPSLAPQRPFYFNQSQLFSNTSNFTRPHDFPISAKPSVRNIQPQYPPQAPFPYQGYVYQHPPQPVYYPSPHYIDQNQRAPTQQLPSEVQYSYANNNFHPGMNGGAQFQQPGYYGQPHTERMSLAGH